MADGQSPKGEGLDVVDVRVKYGRNEALHGVNVHVTEGKITALVGPNGAGKTTLLNTCMGMVRTAAGRIEWRGRDITTLSPADRVRHGVSMVPQGAVAFPNLSVLENLIVAAQDVVERHAMDEQLDAVFGTFPELRDKSNARAADLSGGQRQMVAIGRALIQRPGLLLVDEPSFGLAVGVRKRVVDALSRFRDEQGGTVLLAEQDGKMVDELADVAYFISAGEIESVAG